MLPASRSIIMLGFIILMVSFLFAPGSNEKEHPHSLLFLETKQNGGCTFHGSFEVHRKFELRFIIRNDLLYLRKIRGQDLVLFYKFSQDVVYLKVFHIGILWYKNQEYNLPLDVPQEGLIKCLRKCIRTKVRHIESRFSRYHQAKRSFKTPRQLSWSEVEILAKMSETIARRMLSASRAQKQLIQRFHLLIKGLVNAAGPPLQSLKPSIRDNIVSKPILMISESDLPATFDLKTTKRENNTSPHHDNQTSNRCTDMRRASRKMHCFGMCGTWCWCWPWVCGDCCLHKGCLQHDECCQKNGYLSVYCFCPWVFGFDCEHGYMGYPECLYS